MKQNVNLITLPDIARIAKTLLKKTLKLQLALSRRNFPGAFFSENFQSKHSLEHMFREEHYHELIKQDSTTDVF